MSKNAYYLASSVIDCIDDRNLRDLELLLKYYHADPNIIVPDLEMTPFHYVVGNESEEFAENAVKLFISYGGNPNIRSKDGLTPVHVAAAWGKANIFCYLLRNGGDPHLKDNENRSAIDYALEEGHADLIKDLSCPNYQKSEIFKNNTSPITNHKSLLQLELSKDNSEHNSISLPSSDENSKNQYVHDWCNKYIKLEEIKSEGYKEKSPENANKKRRSLCSKINERLKNCRKLSSSKKLSSTDNYIICKHTCSGKTTLKIRGSNSDTEVNCKSDIANVTDNMSVCSKQNFRSFSENNLTFLQPSSENICFCNSTSNDQNVSAVDIDEINKTIENLEIFKTPNKNIEEKCIRQKNTSFKHNISENSKNSIYKDGYSFVSGVHPLIFSRHSDKSTFSLRENEHFPFRSPNENKCNSLLTSDRSSCNNFNNAFLMTSDCSELNSVSGIGMVFKDNTDRSSIKSENTIISISAEYEYLDTKEGIKFIERRLQTPFKTVCATESLMDFPVESVLPLSEDYDTDTLRLELTELGEPPGPITCTTKHVYLKKLISLRKYVPIPISKKISVERVYSIELERTLRNPSWHTNLTPYVILEQQIAEQFSKPDPKKRWREGITKSSFTYLLLDPRLSDNLPLKNSTLSQDFKGFENIWKVFLSAIFYVGKGKRSRPFSHLYKTISIWNKGLRQTNDKKMQTILDIWKDNYGVVCLHVFQNVIPVEAYTREAAMIDAIGLKNLKNIKSGDYYGLASTWSCKQKRMLGVYLIYKALLIYLNEGERQLRPADID